MKNQLINYDDFLLSIKALFQRIKFIQYIIIMDWRKLVRKIISFLLTLCISKQKIRELLFQ